MIALLCGYVFLFWRYIQVSTIKYIIMNIISFIYIFIHIIFFTKYLTSTLCYFQRLIYLRLKMRTIYVFNALTFIQFSIKLICTRTHILHVIITNNNTNIIMYIVGTYSYFPSSKSYARIPHAHWILKLTPIVYFRWEEYIPIIYATLIITPYIVNSRVFILFCYFDTVHYK